MKIKTMTNLMISFYVVLILVVSYSIYNLETQSSLFIIYMLMLIALISFIFTYRQVRKKILEPIFKVNEIILAYQNGDESVKEFESNDDEVGLMIQEFFIMKKKLDEDYAKLEKLALTDPLTEILNRRAFFEVSEQILKISLRNKKSFSILLVDIDFFKKVNDVYGHLVGDDILKYLVSMVTHEIRESDVFARYGGEEFIVMLPDTDEAGAGNLAEKIRESIEVNPFTCEKLSVGITVSIGVAELKDEKLLRDIIHRADEALYTAKESGRNKVEIAK
ncbi:diguanylate cyclase [Sulfurimonas sp.]|nr:diguanylate cyclase [Sulfurimonas sp.]